MAGDLGIAHRVRFAGDVDQTTLTALYHACDVFALPSVTHAEAFGMVQLEAMACRKPVVSTRLPSGVPWVNRDGDSGLVVTPGDADALAGALRTLLADKELRARMGERGHARVVHEFTIERMAAQTTALYHEVLGHGAAGQATRGAGHGAHAANGAALDTRPARRTA
jgi:rhamnosyl/mannosyltransferase